MIADRTEMFRRLAQHTNRLVAPLGLNSLQRECELYRTALQHISKSGCQTAMGAPAGACFAAGRSATAQDARDRPCFPCYAFIALKTGKGGT